MYKWYSSLLLYMVQSQLNIYLLYLCIFLHSLLSDACNLCKFLTVDLISQSLKNWWHYQFIHINLMFWKADETINFVRLGILMVASIKMPVFWDGEPCSVVEIDWCFRGAYCLHHWSNDLCPDDGDSKHLWNTGQFTSDYMVQEPWRESSSVNFVTHSYNIRTCCSFHFDSR
jgi:hypothetical protein